MYVQVLCVRYSHGPAGSVSFSAALPEAALLCGQRDGGGLAGVVGGIAAVPGDPVRSAAVVNGEYRCDGWNHFLDRSIQIGIEC